MGEADPRPQGLLRGRLDLVVERRDQGVPGLGHAASGHRGVLLGVALGVHLDLGDAVAAAQPLVVGPLQAALADDVASGVALEVLRLQVLGRDRTDGADHVGGEVPVRIGAQVLVHDFDARIRQRVLLDVRPDPGVHIFLERDQVDAGDVLLHDGGPLQVAHPRLLRDRAPGRRLRVLPGIGRERHLEVGRIGHGRDGVQAVVGLRGEARQVDQRAHLQLAGQRRRGRDVDDGAAAAGACGRRDRRLVDGVADLHVLEFHGARLQVVHDPPAQRAGLHLQIRRELGELRVERALGHVHQPDPDQLATAVLHDDLTVTIDDVAALRDDLDGLEAVVVGLGHELLAAQDLQEPEAEEDDAEHHRGDADDDGDAQGDRRQLDDGLVAAAGADRPVAARRVTSEQRHADHLPL